MGLLGNSTCVSTEEGCSAPWGPFMGPLRCLLEPWLLRAAGLCLWVTETQQKTVLPCGTCVCVLTIKAIKTPHDPRLCHFQKKRCQFKLDLYDSRWYSKNQGTPHH